MSSENQQFVFTGREKMATYIMMGVGVISILWTIFFGGYGEGIDAAYGQNRVWTNLLHNSVFFLGLSFLALFFYAAFVVAIAGWHVMFKRVMEAMFAFLPVGGILVLIILIGGVLHWHDLYHWIAVLEHNAELSGPEAEGFDKIIDSKKGFLNIVPFLGASAFFVFIWWFWSNKLRTLSLKEDEDSNAGLKWYKRIKSWSAIFLPIGGATSAFAFWYWLMSIEPHWYSTMFAWYATASLMSSCIAVIMLLLLYLQSRGYYPNLQLTHYHDLGKYLFAFSVFWTYLWFSQYMLIWYANIGEETIHFQNQQNYFPVVFYGILILNFVLPLLVLMRNSTKWKAGSVIFMSIIILLGHWLDFFLMIKPGVYMEIAHHAGGGHGEDHALPFLMGYNIPGLLEIGTMIGFAGMFIFFTLRSLGKAALVPKNDPMLEESEHHLGGPLGPELELEHHH